MDLIACNKCLYAVYLGSLGDAEITDLALHEYRNATNMTEQFAALVALEQQPGKSRDEVLADFYNKWQCDYLVCIAAVTDLLLFLNLVFHNIMGVKKAKGNCISSLANI